MSASDTRLAASSSSKDVSVDGHPAVILVEDDGANSCEARSYGPDKSSIAAIEMHHYKRVATETAFSKRHKMPEAQSQRAHPNYTIYLLLYSFVLCLLSSAVLHPESVCFTMSHAQEQPQYIL